jgi:lysyl-tRNA synthetase, class I
MKSWPYQQAQLIIDKINGKLPDKGYVLFETGYGPSGLPHIGTFGEVLRTTFVRRAFEELTGMPTKLIAFSDDMDGLRKVPDNVPKKDMLREYLNKPLTSVPDPFGTANSFGEHNNKRLCAFLDSFGFEYDFRSSTEVYKSGAFDNQLISILENYDKIMNIMLPSLREERQQTYSPILPVCPRTGNVLQVPIIERKSRSVVYMDPETNEKVEVPVTGGNCKLQWKADWAMRWVALDVDYEMAGKDLIESTKLSSAISKAIGGTPPAGFNYELFLDENSQKISKSKGNGISLDEWLKYAPQESLAYYMFQNPQRAKRLCFDVIPQSTDEYLKFLESYHKQTHEMQKDNPVYHIHNRQPPKTAEGISFALLLNLVSVCNTNDKKVLWGFISKYTKASAESNPFLDKLVEHSIVYYNDFILPNKRYKTPSDKEKIAISDLSDGISKLTDISAESIQTLTYEIGKNHGYEDLKLWFQALYEILLGQSSGPRIGSFFALYGSDKTIELIKSKI